MNKRVDPFETISEKEKLWQEVSDTSQEVRADVKGKASDKTKVESYRGMSAEDVKKLWANRRAKTKQKSLKNKVGE